jgi:tripartite-type tricarboxylate transporter receptor subunit TctC
MKFVVARLLCVAALVLAAPALAQDYPAREIHVVCSFPPGTGADIVVRYFAGKLSVLAGKPVVVENKAGALGNIGTEAVAKSRPDGYTIQITPGSSTHAASLHTFKKLPFDPVKDFAPIATLATSPFVLVVAPQSPIKSVADLTELLKSKKDKASYAAATNTGNVATELYMNLVGATAVPVPYRDINMAVPDLLGGIIDYFFSNPVLAIEQHKAGRLRALAVTSSRRFAALPDVPPMNDVVPGFGDYAVWWSAFAPAGTPQPILDKLTGWFLQVVAMEDTRQFLAANGSDPLPGDGKALADLLARDIRKWGDYVKLAKIQPE